MDKYEILKEYFGYNSFRGIQELAIDSILNGCDTICVMATGGGKSITFQVPSLIFEGLTIVISPLISLMDDQVKHLKQKGINAETINSNLSYHETQRIYEDINACKIKFLYLSPERLQNQHLLKIIKTVKISHIVLDESHCMSMWGRDFRPSYLKIKDFIDSLENRPIVSCFTATANEMVISDISNGLGLRSPKIFKSTFDRPNLYYEVVHTNDKFNYLEQFLNKHSNENGIIYCLTRKKASYVFQYLLDNKYQVSLYHGGLDDDIRKKYQDEYLLGETKIMVATKAFGMGIDKPDIRYVINFDLPESIEDLSQQQGRCSRDGKPGMCIVLYHESDYYMNECFINCIENEDELTKDEIKELKKIKRKMFKDVISYVTTKRCLHEYLVSYFGELYFSYCMNCSNCNHSYNMVNVFEESKIIISLIRQLNGRFGANMIADVLCGNKSEAVRRNNLQYNRFFNKIRKEKWIIKEIIVNLINDGYIKRSNLDYPTLSINALTNNFFRLSDYKIKLQ